MLPEAAPSQARATVGGRNLKEPAGRPCFLTAMLQSSPKEDLNPSATSRVPEAPPNTAETSAYVSTGTSHVQTTVVSLEL